MQITNSNSKSNMNYSILSIFEALLVYMYVCVCEWASYLPTWYIILLTSTHNTHTSCYNKTLVDFEIYARTYLKFQS